MFEIDEEDGQKIRRSGVLEDANVRALENTLSGPTHEALHPMQQEEDPHALQPWKRLRRNGLAVGYVRQQGRVTLYSKDGYGWSGEAIEADTYDAQVPFGIARRRVYHGDVVLMPAGPGRKELAERLILVSTDNNVILFDPLEERLEKLADRWPDDDAPRARKVVRTAHGDPALEASVSRAFRLAQDASSSSGWEVLGLVSSIGGTGLIGIGIQIAVLGHVGPVSTLASALAGSILFWLAQRRFIPGGIRRQRLLRMGMQSGLVLLVAGAGTGLWLRGLGDTAAAAAHPGLVLAAYGGLGFLAGLACAVIGGDLVAWQAGGYGDESDKPLGVPDGF